MVGLTCYNVTLLYISILAFVDRYFGLRTALVGTPYILNLDLPWYSLTTSSVMRLSMLPRGGIIYTLLCFVVPFQPTAPPFFGELCLLLRSP